MSKDNSKNAGQWRNKFQVVIAGSNGYVSKSIAPQDGYSGPTFLGNAAINAPLDCSGADTYIQPKVFTSGPFDAGLCAAACSAQSAYNLAHPPSDGTNPKTCQFFNTYMLLKNGVPEGQYCSMVSLASPATSSSANQLLFSTLWPGITAMPRTLVNTVVMISTPSHTASRLSTGPTLASRLSLAMSPRPLLPSNPPRCSRTAPPCWATQPQSPPPPRVRLSQLLPALPLRP